MLRSRHRPLICTHTHTRTLRSVQFGFQPLLAQRYTNPTSNLTVTLFIQELVKIFLAGAFLALTSPSDDHLRKTLMSFSFKGYLQASCFPSFLYSLQNVLLQLSYKSLSPITFNLLNQTKTLFAAVCCYLVLGRRQTPIQRLALMLLALSSVIIEGTVPVLKYLTGLANYAASLGEEGALPDVSSLFASGHSAFAENGFDALLVGVAPCLLASFLSGLNGALTQYFLQSSSSPKNSYMYSMELSSFMLLLYGLWVVKDGVDVRKEIDDFGVLNMIPIVTQALGGILVGLVTKHAGSVRKG